MLVADATGSGKTRMGVHLIGAVRDHIVRSNRLRQGMALMISPPAVCESWQREAMLSSTPLAVHSHGELSHARSRGHDLIVETLRRAQILCVDEGHNFLNFGSARTQHLLRNMADHVLLFTATPINKSAADLLRIADMLGADNLDESTLKVFKQMLGVGNLNRTLTEAESRLLKAEINRFTVRRTKRQLNQMVEAEPDKYRDQHGKLCRYPEHRPQVYPLDEPEHDRALAARIRELAGQLYAVSHFVKPIELPDVLRAQGVTEEQYLRGRLNSAKKIAAYIIMSSLRSSRLALAEHVQGTDRAVSDFGLNKFRKQKASEGAIEKLQNLSGKRPENRLSISLPEWLSDTAAHEVAIAHDRAIYEEIYALTMRMSPGREQTKAKHLARLLSRHALVLAFDSRPITLAFMEQLIEEIAPKVRVITATGETPDKKREMMEAFRHGSKEKNLIGLCSDSLSEGVNLQQASVIVHLDMPSVVRIAEQRVGRVDRMDSPHVVIEAWWPDDATEFALSSDDRFIERYETVENLLGSNLPLPQEMLEQRRGPLCAHDLIEEYERGVELEEWDGISDAFKPVRQLVEGERALISGDVYEAYRHVKARVLSRVSLVRARAPWAFFCLSAGSFATPRWLMLPSRSARPIHELENITAALRERLTDQVEDIGMTEQASRYLEDFLRQLASAERDLLPRRKQRALEEMEYVLAKYAEQAGRRGDQRRVDAYSELLNAIKRPLPDYQPNWDEVAARWLDLVRPVWHERLQSAKTKLLVLKDIRKDMLEREEEMGEKIIAAYDDFPRQQPTDERIITCIVGVPD
ncbi:MAG: SNF2-related protein [Thiohalomonadaceae bacterium]